jgi:hypothetical protein
VAKLARRDRRVREMTRIDQAGIDANRAREAADLLRRTGTTDVVDALVVVEALRRAPSILVTGNPDGLRSLLDASPDGRHVEVWTV